MTAMVVGLYQSVLSSLFLLLIPASSFPAQPVKPLYEVPIDYSAANEYVEAHYGEKSSRNPYFGYRGSKLEPIYNARNGVYDGQSWKPAALDQCGFCLWQDEPSQVTDWTDLLEVRDVYLPEVRKILKKSYSGIHHVIFWNPMLREEDLPQTRPNNNQKTPTASFAAMPHIDTDVGAHSNAEHLMDLFEKNRIDEGVFPRDELINAIQEGHRFAIVNVWRNISPQPVARAPLALFSTRYDTSQAFPEAAPNMDRSRWYIFDKMTQDEVLLFCQYDRDREKPSDLWHCALKSVGDRPPRRSLDVRCLIVFDELVPTDRDRFGPNRLGSLLTQTESASFCSEQSSRRRQMGDKQI
jgi:hypothetical protein